MARAIIPLFPLGSVLFPGLALPLHIFEERYRLLVARLSEGEDDLERSFGVVAIRAGHEVGAASVAALHEVGTTALLRRVTPYPDGRSDIVSVGARRFRLHAVDDSLPYLQGEVEWIPDDTGPTDSLPALSASVATRFADYQTLLAGGPEADPDLDEVSQLPDDPTVLSYLVSAAMLLDLGDRQRLLAAPSTADRLARLSSLLAREQTVIGLLGAVPATDLLRSGVTLN
ncbi:MAG: LON peptidase substrate-binding domain-containing protein [Jiangellales bacterium]